MSRHIKPRYKHDCDGCVFLGQYNEYDLYFCARSDSDMGGTVIARYGNDGSNYASHGASIAGMHKLSSEHMQMEGTETIRALRVALLIAFDMDLTGKYKDNRSKGYRIIRYAQAQNAFIRDEHHTRVFVTSQLIDNERKAYSMAYANDDAEYHIEIAQIISTNKDYL